MISLESSHQTDQTQFANWKVLNPANELDFIQAKLSLLIYFRTFFRLNALNWNIQTEWTNKKRF